jgi:hypothetical protein
MLSFADHMWQAENPGLFLLLEVNEWTGSYGNNAQRT